MKKHLAGGIACHVIYSIGGSCLRCRLGAEAINGLELRHTVVGHRAEADDSRSLVDIYYIYTD